MDGWRNKRWIGICSDGWMDRHMGRLMDRMDRQRQIDEGMD